MSKSWKQDRRTWRLEKKSRNLNKKINNVETCLYDVIRKTREIDNAFNLWGPSLSNEQAIRYIKRKKLGTF